jgi:hypothetical protein
MSQIYVIHENPSWLAPLAEALCGFFNRFNDALGIEEEEEALA